MSKLSAFLHPVTTSEEKEVVISNRFQDESGQPVPFKIRALTQEENDAITRQATRCWCPVNCCCPASMPGWSRRLRSCPALRSRRMR